MPERATRFAALALAGLLSACAAVPAPTPLRPAVELPAAWQASGPAYAADGRWWTVFGEPALDALVAEALAHNADIALAVARVDEAEALYAGTVAAARPQLGVNASRGRSLSSAATGLFPAGVPRERNNYRATLDVQWEIDLWGRIASARGAARAELLASAAARDAVRASLAAQVVRGWIGLQALDATVALTRRTLALQEGALALQVRRSDAGLVSAFEVRQLEAEIAATRAQLPPLERDRDAAASALAVLAGRSPRAILTGGIARAPAATDAAPAPVLPHGLPSELLLARPDLAEAELRLAAANARVAVARAAWFPSISLTGALGSESASLASLFSGPAGLWSFAAALAQPVFDGGRREADRQAAEARERQAVALYQRSIQNAFREVRDALAAQTHERERFEAERAREAALAATLKLAAQRFEQGLIGRLELIDAERNLLAAERGRIDARAAQKRAIADLFRALGAGPHADPAPVSTR